MPPGTPDAEDLPPVVEDVEGGIAGEPPEEQHPGSSSDPPVEAKEEVPAPDPEDEGKAPRKRARPGNLTAARAAKVSNLLGLVLREAAGPGGGRGTVPRSQEECLALFGHFETGYQGVLEKKTGFKDR